MMIVVVIILDSILFIKILLGIFKEERE